MDQAADELPWGYAEGETCNRKQCKGEISCHPVENCSCHINSPCNACTSPRNFCPICDWEEANEERVNGFVVQVDPVTQVYKSWERRQLDKSKIDWHNLHHTHFSMIKEGVYPEGTSQSEVLEKVKGTFGGRFEWFGNGRFKYIAYTD